MENKIINLDEYRKLLELQKKYESGEITEDDMTITQIDALYNLYLIKIKSLKNKYVKKLVQIGGGE